MLNRPVLHVIRHAPIIWRKVRLTVIFTACCSLFPVYLSAQQTEHTVNVDASPSVTQPQYVIDNQLIAHHGDIQREGDQLHLTWQGIPNSGSVYITWHDLVVGKRHILKASAKDSRVTITDPNPNRRTLFLVKNYRTGQMLTLTERKVPANGMDNFRDMGGYLTDDGKMTRWGLIYRADTFSKLTQTGYQYVNNMNLGHIFDLRNQQEVNKKPDPAFAHITYHHTQILDQPSGYEMMKWQTDEDKQHFSESPKALTFYHDANRYMTEAKYNHQMLRQIFQTALQAKGKALVWHCSGGKDRTGFVSAVFLRALGVPEATIINDYLLTNVYRRAFDDKEYQEMEAVFKGPTKQQALTGFLAIQQARPEYIQSGLHAITQRYGSIENYLQTVVGISAQDLATLKSLYTQPVTETW